MATRWRLKDYLKSNNLTPYALAQETAGKLSMNAIYNLVSDVPPTNIRVTTFDALIPALEKLTGQRVEVQDLLEFDRD